jgi:hypothetical protein
MNYMARVYVISLLLTTLGASPFERLGLRPDFNLLTLQVLVSSAL